MQPCGTPAVLQYTATAFAGVAASEAAATDMKTAASAALKDFDLLNIVISPVICLFGTALDLLAVATDAAIHAPERAAPTSHDHGMESAGHFDEVPVTFNTNPSNRKVMS
jgi:hypothetical protein